MSKLFTCGDVVNWSSWWCIIIKYVTFVEFVNIRKLELALSLRVCFVFYCFGTFFASDDTPCWVLWRVIARRFWLCISITTQAPPPSPAAFLRRWSRCQSSTTWAGNTRYVHMRPFSGLPNLFFLHQPQLFMCSFRWNSCPTWLWSPASVAKNTSRHTLYKGGRGLMWTKRKERF